VERVIVAGTRLSDTDVASMAGKLREAGMGDSAERMEGAFEDGSRLFHLSAEERLAFFEALDDCPDELRQLRASLQEQVV
jgi:hypothetical protein